LEGVFIMFLSKRNGIYYVFYNNARGKRTCISTKSKLKSDAIKFLVGFKDELKKREQNNVILISLQYFINNYLYYSASFHAYKTSKDYKCELGILMRFTNNIQVNEITPKLVNDYLRERGKKSIYTSAKSLRYLRSIFNWAITEKYLIENPCKDIKPIKIPEKQPLFFSETDFQILIKSIDSKDIRDIVIFAVNTGLRLMELITLQWNQINLKDKYLILDNINHTTKSKKIRTLALNNRALQILNEKQFQNDKNVFTINNLKINPDVLSKKFKKYIISSGLNPKLKFHSLRHTFASWLVQRGVSIYEVSKLLGHSNIKTTEIYSHLIFVMPYSSMQAS